MSTKAGKRPLRSLTAHEKMDAIRRVHDGESKASVARDIGVPESTLRGWCKNEDKILYLSRQSTPDTDESNDPAPKEKKPKYEDLLPYNLSGKQSEDAATPVKLSSPATSPCSTNKPDLNSVTPVVVTSSTPNGALNLSPVPGSGPEETCGLNLSTTKRDSPKNSHHLLTTTASMTPTSMSAASNTVAAQLNERERNRAELARLSVELGLNRPEMFAQGVTSQNLSELALNLGLTAHWGNILLQQQQQLVAASSTTKKTASTLHSDTINSIQTPPKVTKDSSKSKSNTSTTAAQGGADDLMYLVKTQQAMMNLLQNPKLTTSSNTAPVANGLGGLDQNAWFWNWYKSYYIQQQQAAALQQTAQVVVNQTQQSLTQQPLVTTTNNHTGNPPEKPILYQQLTKDASNAENLLNKSSPGDTTTTPNTPGKLAKSVKSRTVFDNLLLHNNNNNNITSLGKIVGGGKDCTSNGKTDDCGNANGLTPTEALDHGEKFLEWLENFSDPSVTGLQVLQFRSLLNNVRSCTERKNGDAHQQMKAKVKRK